MASFQGAVDAVTGFFQKGLKDGLRVPPTNMSATAYGSTASTLRQIGKGAVKANGAANGNPIVNMAKSIDAGLGGHGQAVGSQAYDAFKGTKLGSALIPSSGEMGAQVRRNITAPGSNVNQGELMAGLQNQITARGAYAQQLGNYEAALTKAGYNMSDEGVQAAMKGTYKLGDSDVNFDFSGLGTTQEVIDKNFKTIGKQTAGEIGALNEQLQNAGQGFVMTDQNALEKAQTYFSNAEHGKTRMIAAGVGTAGVMVGGRLMSGGSLTRDSEGRRDIAGVPFI